MQDSGDWLAADRCFAQVQQRDLSQSESLFRRAQIQARAWSPADARWLLQQVLHHRPDALPAHTLMAQVLLDLGEIDQARRLLLRQLRATPAHAEHWRLLALIQRQRGRPALARCALQRALRHDPSHTEAMRMLAWLALEQHDASWRWPWCISFRPARLTTPTPISRQLLCTPRWATWPRPAAMPSGRWRKRPRRPKPGARCRRCATGNSACTKPKTPSTPPCNWRPTGWTACASWAGFWWRSGAGARRTGFCARAGTRPE